MAKHKCKLNDDLEALTREYMEKTDTDLDTVINAALRAYLLKKMKKSEITRVLSESDATEGRIDQFLNASFDQWIEG